MSWEIKPITDGASDGVGYRFTLMDLVVIIMATLVKRLGIAFLLRSHFFGLTWFFSHAIVNFRWKGTI